MNTTEQTYLTYNKPIYFMFGSVRRSWKWLLNCVIFFLIIITNLTSCFPIHNRFWRYLIRWATKIKFCCTTQQTTLIDAQTTRNLTTITLTSLHFASSLLLVVYYCCSHCVPVLYSTYSYILQSCTFSFRICIRYLYLLPFTLQPACFHFEDRRRRTVPYSRSYT